MLIFPYDPDYGLPNDLRSEAVLLSIKYGTRRAAEQMKLAQSTIYKWRKDCGLNNKENRYD